MKKSIISILSFFLMISPQVFSQNIDLYAVTYYGPIQFGEVDKQNGVIRNGITVDQTQSHLTTVYSSAFDQASQHYLFVSRETRTSDFYFHRVDAKTGTTLSSNVIGEEERVIGLQYDLRSGKLYGLRFDSTTSQVYIAQVDPDSGKIMNEHLINGPVDLCIRSSCIPETTFDPQRGIYVFIGWDSTGASRLYRVKATTGMVLTDLVITQELNEIQYNVTDDKLYGIRFDPNLPLIELVGMDSANNQQHIQYLSATGSSILVGSGAFDQQSQTYFFMQKPISQGYFHLTFYNVPKDSLSITATDNSLREPEIDNSHFAKTHFGLYPTSIQPPQEVNISVFPNPVIDRLMIETAQIDGIIHSVCLSDMTGKQVMANRSINSKSCYLDVSALAKGIYQMSIQVGDQIVHRRVCIRP